MLPIRKNLPDPEQKSIKILFLTKGNKDRRKFGIDLIFYQVIVTAPVLRFQKSNIVSFFIYFLTIPKT